MDFPRKHRYAQTDVALWYQERNTGPLSAVVVVRLSIAETQHDVGSLTKKYGRLSQTVILYNFDARTIHIYGVIPALSSSSLSSSSAPLETPALPFMPLPSAQLAYTALDDLPNNALQHLLGLLSAEAAESSSAIAEDLQPWLLCELLPLTLARLPEQSPHYTCWLQRYIDFAARCYELAAGASDAQLFALLPELEGRLRLSVTAVPRSFGLVAARRPAPSLRYVFSMQPHSGCTRRGCMCLQTTPLFFTTDCSAAALSVLLEALAVVLQHEFLLPPPSIKAGDAVLVSLADHGAEKLCVLWSFIFDVYSEALHTLIADALQQQLAADSAGFTVSCPAALPQLDALRRREAPAVPTSIAVPASQERTQFLFSAPHSCLLGDAVRAVARNRVDVLRRTPRQVEWEALAQRLVRPYLTLPETHRPQPSWRIGADERALLADKDALRAFLLPLSARGQVHFYCSLGKWPKAQVDGHISISLTTGRWKEYGAKHGQEEGTGLASFVAKLRGIDIASASALVGSASALPAPPTRPLAQEQQEDSAAFDKLMARCSSPLSPAGVAARYLRQARGLGSDAPLDLVERNPALMQSDALFFRPDNAAPGAAWTKSAGLVVRTADGRACQRIFLDSRTAQKRTDMGKAKKTSGRLVADDGSACGAVLQRGTNAVCFVCEGPETALSVALAAPRCWVLATFGCAQLPKLAPPAGVAQLVVCRENDSEAALFDVNAKVAELRRRWPALVEVWPPAELKDFNDVHQQQPGAAGTMVVAECLMRQLRPLGVALDSAPLKRSADDVHLERDGGCDDGERHVVKQRCVAAVVVCAM